jgi:hypothetical protein
LEPHALVGQGRANAADESNEGVLRHCVHRIEIDPGQPGYRGRDDNGTATSRQEYWSQDPQSEDHTVNVDRPQTPVRLNLYVPHPGAACHPCIQDNRTERRTASDAISEFRPARQGRDVDCHRNPADLVCDHTCRMSIQVDHDHLRPEPGKSSSSVRANAGASARDHDATASQCRLH